MVAPAAPLQIGALLFEGLDQIDFTGPFEVLSRLPDSRFTSFAKTCDPVRDIAGLRLIPDARLDEASTVPISVLRDLAPLCDAGGADGHHDR